MDTTRYIAFLLVFLFVPFILGGDSVEEDPFENFPQCHGNDNETLTKDNRLVRCLNCVNVAANVDTSTDEACNCPEGRICGAREKTGSSPVVFEYYCTKEKVDISQLNSGLYLEGSEDPPPS